MEHADVPRPSYVMIWLWLVLLLVVGLVVFGVPIPKTTAVLLIFGIAAVKAALVVRHYMHMKHQPVMLYVIAGIPVILAIAMILSLLPDIAFK